MKKIIFDYEHTCLIHKDTLYTTGTRLLPEIERITNAHRLGGYDSIYASVNLPDDIEMLAKIKTIVKNKKTLNPTMLIVVGIGGSNLGLKAIHQALYGLFYNEQQPDIKLYYADTIDTDYIEDIVLLMEQELEQGNNILINIVSKSGNTTETMANALLFVSILRNVYPDTYHQYIVVTTDKNSALWHFADENNIEKLPIPSLVGGRYSVFSAAALFPLALLDVDIEALMQGACEMRNLCLNTNIANNPAAVRASLLTEYYQKKIIVHDMFIFSPDLTALGAWYRQLMGESLGKEYTTDGKKACVGIIPTVSIGTVDLHSVAQLYLGGPSTIFTTFVAVQENNSSLIIPEYETKKWQQSRLLQKKSLPHLMQTILQGTQKAYNEKNRPFVLLTIPSKTPYYIGMLMQLHMLEIMYAGFLLHVNPFDQPEVELYKKEIQLLLNGLQ